MARPQKDGIDYFPFDVDLLGDDKVKLIRAEFGALGIVIFLTLLSDIYHENGYYKQWSNDCCLLTPDKVGCGCTPANVAEVVQGCVRRSLFDEGVFNMFGVLTSAGIQRRYLRAVAERSNIEFYKEYFLLDLSSQKDIPGGILKKLTFKYVNLPNNEVNLPNNEVNLPNNPQSKVKESKEEKRNNISVFFEQLWTLYPSKKGKGKVSDAAKQRLAKIGIEEMTRAIDRYTADLKKDDWRKPQNGSTFFNSGYIDYLDVNYEPPETAEPSAPRKSHIEIIDGREVTIFEP